MNHSRGKSKDAEGSTTSGFETSGTYALRSASGTPSKKQSSLSSSSMQKPERLEKHSPLTTPDKRVKKQSMPSPARRSERGENQQMLQMLSCSGSEKYEESSSSSDTENGDQKGPVVVLRKKKWLDARSFRAFLQFKSKKAGQPDFGEKFGRQDNSSDEDSRRYDNLSDGDSGCSGTGGSKDVDGIDECNGKKGGEESLEKSSSGSGKLADGTVWNVDDRKIVSAHVSRNCKICSEEAQEPKHRDSSLPKYSDRLLQSSPDGLKGEGTLDDAARLEMDCSTRADLQETVMDGDRTEAECLVIKDLQTPELIFSTSSRGRTPASNFVLERGGTDGTLKGKRNAPDPDSDISVTAAKEICGMETSSADAISSSPSGGTTSQISRSCAACFKRQRVGCDSRKKEVCFCNVTSLDLSGISLSKEVHEEVAIWTQNNSAVGSCFQENRSKEKLDRDAKDPSAEAQKTNVPSMMYGSVSPKEDGERLEVSKRIGLTKDCCNSMESSLDTRRDTDNNACVICKLGGELLCCHGKGCRSGYHLYCLDPSLIDVPPGVWHCLHCVRKKIESGIHAVSEGVESICDVREVEVSNSKGMQKEKQYLVKYKGLAHVHNRWIPEKQLVDEAFVLVSKFELRHQKEKAVVKWKLEWTVPQRLLKKRLVMSPKQADDYFGGCGHNFSNYLYEWLVKWKGLGYEHATWELENEPFLSTDEAMALIRDYESRYEKSKKSSDPSRVLKVLQERNGSFHELPTLPSGCSPGLDNDHLACVNKLRECWHKCQNAIVIDDQERIMEVIFFIISLESYACRPFLIISSSTVLHVWEAELRRLAPSINVVTYSGNKDVRKCIQALEFYEEGGCAMVEVLLSSPDVVVEDLEALELLGWEAIIVDECQYSRVSQHFEQIKMLASDFRLLLCSGQLKDNIPEYINLLSFLDSESNGINDDSSMIGPSDDIGILAGLKERLAQYIAYERKLDSKFIEYWVPVQLSDVQLEQYCNTLLSNSCSLRSCAKTDHVGALRDILSLTRKCCDHPYLVDLSLQMKLTKGHPEIEYLDVGINASGKLQLLDKLLPEIKKRGLRTLILFQSSGRSRQYSIGDILDDYLRQRFGTYSYERVDSGLSNSKKQAALNIFNDKARGRFAFLIENRACLSSIKLSAVDTIIIFDSDWNPLNDLRYLQKICIDSQCEHLKVFRLYSSCTVEEKSLILAKQGMTIESTRENINRSTSHMLLIWGASYLFNELDKFHGCSSPSVDSNTSDPSLLNDVVSELLTELPHTAEESSISNPVILKVKHSGVTYPRSISLLGETVMQSRDEESPHVFWRKLLEGRYPSWRYISMPSPRARKKVQYFDELLKKPEAVNDEVTKKRKKAVDSITDPIYLGTWSERKRRAISSDRKTKMINISKLGQSPNGSSFASPKKASISSGSSGTQAENGVSLSNINDLNDSSTMSPMAQDISKVPHVNKVGAEGRKKLRDAQKSLYILLKPEISKLCETLQLPEDVKHIAGKFLEYMMNRYHVSTEPGTIFQAFQISLCWTAAALSEYKVNHRESLELAKEHLHFQCNEDEAESVYSKLQMLMKRFSHQMSASRNATAMTSLKVKSNASRNEDILRRSFHGKTSESISSDSQELEERERRESSQRTSQECTSDSLRNGHILRQLLDERTFESAASDQQEVEDGEIRESSQIHSWPGRGPVEREQAPYSAKANEMNDGANMHPSSHLEEIRSHNCNFSNKIIRQIEKKFARRMNRILREQLDEVQAFHKYKERESAKLKKEHRLQSDLICTVHDNPLVRLDMLKMVDEDFARKMDEHDRWMDNRQRKLVARHQGVRKEEEWMKAHMLEQVKSGQLSEPLVEEPLLDSGLGQDNMDIGEHSGVHDVMGNKAPMSGPSETENVNVIISDPAQLTVPNGIMAEISGRDPNDVAQGLPIGTVTATVQSSGRSAVTSESDVMKDKALGRGAWAGFEQHSRAANSDSACLISSTQQNRINLPSLPQSRTNLEQDISVSSLQVPSIDHNEPIVSGAVGSEETRGCEGHSSLQQIEVALPQPADATSLQVEQSNDNVRVSQLVVQSQPPQSEDPSVCHNQPIRHSEKENEHDLSRCSSPQQTDVATQQAVEAIPPQTEESNHLVSQPVQLVVQLQPPQSEDPTICHNQPIRHSVVESEHELSRSSSSQQNDMAMQQAVEAIPPRIEQSNHSVSQPVQLVVQLQSPQSEDPSIRHNQPIRHSVAESEHEPSRCSFPQQTDMATQQAVEAIPPRTEQSNHSVSQPVQLVVQLQPPQSENPSICHNQPIRHSVVESERELSNCSSSLQTYVATQQAVVAIHPGTKQSNHSVSQPFQLVVQLQPPQSEDHSICHNQPIRHSVVESEHELSRCSSSQQTDMAMQRAVEAIPPQTAQSNHSVSQHVPPPSMSVLMGIPPVAYPESTGTSPSLTIHLPQTYPVASRQPPVLRPNPLQNELAKLRKEQEQVIKTHEDEKTRLISEREREIKEVCRKYGGLIQNSETACLRQQKALETWISKVNLNLILAEALKLKFADASNPGCTPPRQGTPTVRQQFPILPLPQTAQTPPRAVVPPVQVVHHPTDLFSANPAAPRFRPPMPPTINLSIGTELRAPAPHLQYFRSTSILSPNHFPRLSGIPSQPSPSVLTTTSTLPLPLRSLPSHPLGTFSGTCLPNSSSAFPAFHNPSLSAVEPRVDFNIHSGVNQPNQLRMAEAGSGFGSLVPPIITTPGSNGMGKAIHSATEVVCLLDDD